MSNRVFDFILAAVAILLFPWLYTNYISKTLADVSSSISYSSISQSTNAVSDAYDDSAGGGSGGSTGSGGSGGGGDSGTSSSMNNQLYKNSISLDSLCYLTAEASENGDIYNIFKKYLEIRNNTAPGWIHIKQGHYNSGLSWTLWQNKYESNTYCLVYAGTDQILDTASYLPMMLDEDYCTQMNQAIEVAKSIKNHAKTSIKKLFVAGHSLGGYLASYVVSDMVDYSVNSSQTRSRIKASDIESTLSIGNVRGYTFGAPGFYLYPAKIVGVVKVPITDWAKEKKANNDAGKYNKYIYNYTNNYDPVGHLFIFPNSFKHLGNYKDYKVNKISAGKENEFSRFVQEQGLIGKLYGVANKLIPVSRVYYHLPHVYINVM